MKIRVTADSSCDLPSDILEKYNVRIIPLNVIIDGKSYLDVFEIDTFDLFDAVEKSNKAASTSAVAEFDYRRVFTEILDEGFGIIHICTSRELSASYENAIRVANEFPNVKVIDSRNVSAGIALIALLAVDLVEEGFTTEEICDKLQEAVNRVDATCVLDTISYVRRGGRISSVAAKGVEILHLKPCIEIIDGKLKVGKKYRGKISSVLKSYVSDRLSGRNDIDLKRVFLPNTLYDRELMESLKNMVTSIIPFREVLIIDAGCVISCHAGPNAFGVMFFRK